MKQFNNEFLIGAATAAHQVEGNNIYSDFWILENIPGSSYKEPSGLACDHYNRYQEDIKLMAEAGFNAYRFSIEWARIEPVRGQFDKLELAHYRDVLQCCKDNNIEPIVTLHHFSSPKWLIEEGGWESESTIDYFENYIRYVMEALGSQLTYVCTINEANMGIQISRIVSDFIKKMAQSATMKTQQVEEVKENGEDNTKDGNPDVQVGINLDLTKRQAVSDYAAKVMESFGLDADKVVFLAPKSEKGDAIIGKCHMKAREVIKELFPNIKVGLTLSLYDYQALPGGEEQVAQLWNEDFHHYMKYISEDDFLGVQNYTRKLIDAKGKVEPEVGTKMTEMGNENYPQSLAGVLRYVSKHWKKAIIVTENGISTSKDEERVEFIKAVMNSLHDCIEEGIPVQGYMHWSLMDNFEWQKGYDQKFGLITVDRTTMDRRPKESFNLLGSIRKIGL